MRLARWLALALCLATVACGFKGPLKLPDPPSATKDSDKK